MLQLIYGHKEYHDIQQKRFTEKTAKLVKTCEDFIDLCENQLREGKITVAEYIGMTTPKKNFIEIAKGGFKYGKEGD